MACGMTEFQTGALPYFELPGLFFSGLDELWATPWVTTTT
jgi:hypothetical protein